MLKRKSADILVRYLILILVAIPNFWIFYTILTPLTLYPVYWILGFFYDVSLLSRNTIFVNMTVPIELIKACIAGSAYYLLLVLNLSTPKIKLKKRVNIILLSFAIFLVLNIFRISALSIIAVSGSSIFDITHKLFWYALSTIFVVAIWFFLVWKFKIKGVPFYSDFKFLYKKMTSKR